MREYSYRCHDFSLFTPSFKKWFVSPLLSFLPWAVPANIITIISNLFVYIGFFISVFFHSPSGRFAVATCMFIYLIGDHLDGMQAKRTNTGSALGEFCDHYLDAFNNGIILFTAFLIFEINNPILITAVLATSYLAHMSIFYEQFKTGWLTFEKLGSLEAVLLTSIVIGISSINSIYNILTIQVLSTYRVIDLVFAASAIGAVLTFITTITRIPNRGTEVWLFVLGIVALSTLSFSKFTNLELFVLVTLYASLYVGLIMKGHLVDGIERMPDLVIPGALLILKFINPIEPRTFFFISTIYLSIRISLLIFQTFTTLKIFWVWSNPHA